MKVLFYLFMLSFTVLCRNLFRPDISYVYVTCLRTSLALSVVKWVRKSRRRCCTGYIVIVLFAIFTFFIIIVYFYTRYMLWRPCTTDERRRSKFYDNFSIPKFEQMIRSSISPDVQNLVKICLRGASPRIGEI